MAALLAGLPQSVPGATVNRLCASGLEAVNAAARAVKLGEGDFYLAGGVESMSRAPWVVEKPERGPPPRPADDARHDPGLADDQPADGRARRLDRVDGRDRRERRRALRDQPRGPGRLRPAQPPARRRRRRGGPAGRGDRPDRGAAGPRDRPGRGRRGPAPRRLAGEAGEAAAGLPRGRHRHRRQRLDPQRRRRLPADRLRAGRRGARRRAPGPGRRHAASPASTPPTWASARSRRSPAPSPPPASSLDQIDLVELNEAFASQVLACARELGIEEERLNVNGGAIALGHPLGCSGARLSGTLVRELRRRGGRYGIATLCVGVGQGLATVFEAV